MMVKMGHNSDNLNLRCCRYKKDGVPDELVDAYRAPQLVKDWEDGLIRFFLARVAGEPSSLCLAGALQLRVAQIFVQVYRITSEIYAILCDHIRLIEAYTIEGGIVQIQ